MLQGEMIASGTYAELQASSPVFRQMLFTINQQEQDAHPTSAQRHMSVDQRAIDDVADEDDPLLSTEDLEAQEKGSVKWRVYVQYLQAGAGVIVGAALILSTFGVREGIAAYASWWLAAWSEDEGYRHGVALNCTGMIGNKLQVIRSMSEDVWRYHHNQRFYLFCGTQSAQKEMCRCVSSCLGIFLALTVLTLFRAFALQFLCLNASRVLHNRYALLRF